MTVKWLYYWQPTVGGTVSSQTLFDAFKRVEALHGLKTFRWQITASQFRPNQRDSPVPPVDCARELWGVSFSEVPDKYYFALRQEHMVVEADATMQAIMEKLQVYRNRLTILFEGFQYEMGDFHIKAGRAVLAHTENLRGIVLEVDYKPLSSVEQSRRVVEDFMKVLNSGVITGQFIPLDPNFSEYSLPDLYSWQHTSLQYVTLMAHVLSQQRT